MNLFITRILLILFTFSLPVGCAVDENDYVLANGKNTEEVSKLIEETSLIYKGCNLKLARFTLESEESLKTVKPVITIVKSVDKSSIATNNLILNENKRLLLATCQTENSTNEINALCAATWVVQEGGEWQLEGINETEKNILCSY